MAANSYTIKLDNVILHKFRSGGSVRTPDAKEAIDILLQTHEISIYESLFSSVLRCEIAVIDHINLLTNFPISGEEFIVINYRNVKDGDLEGGERKTLYFVMDTIRDVNVEDNNRSQGYIITGVAIEAYANARQKVQQGYDGKTIPNVVKDIFEEYVTKPTKKVFQQYPFPELKLDQDDTNPATIVVPNLHPFSAMSLLGEIAVTETTDKRYTYMFYQDIDKFNFVTLQSLIDDAALKADAKEHSYMYISNEINTPQSRMKNDGRVVSNLLIVKRYGSLLKVTGGYFQNKLFEINIAQKSFFSTETLLEKINSIYPNSLNTEEYMNYTIIEGDDEESNRTKYVVTSQAENDSSFPLSRSRDRWGKDMISKSAMSQIEYLVTIPGTNRFKAGSLFYLEVPETHGFNKMDADKFVSGWFIVTEVKTLITIGGYHTTVLRINKDSYGEDINRPSRYVEGGYLDA